MLYKFFITQWNNPTKGDWSELVKKDLDDFKIKKDLEVIKCMSNTSFKKKVKKEAKQNAFEVLSSMKDGHSKMENIHYTEIKMQDYMKSENLKLNEALNIFKIRTRMAKFGENFRAGADFILCPLCSEDLDNLKHSFQCKIIRREIEIQGDLSDIYSENVSKETAQIVTKIINTRKKLLEKGGK